MNRTATKTLRFRTRSALNKLPVYARNWGWKQIKKTFNSIPGPMKRAYLNGEGRADVFFPSEISAERLRLKMIKRLKKRSAWRKLEEKWQAKKSEEVERERLAQDATPEQKTQKSRIEQDVSSITTASKDSLSIRLGRRRTRDPSLQKRTLQRWLEETLTGIWQRIVTTLRRCFGLADSTRSSSEEEPGNSQSPKPRRLSPRQRGLQLKGLGVRPNGTLISSPLKNTKRHQRNSEH